MSEYHELIERIWAVTDPKGAMLAIEPGPDMWLMSITRMRMAAEAMDPDRLEPFNEVHGALWRAEHEETHRKLLKNISRCISDYARYIDKLRGCKCTTCQAAVAHLN